MTMAHSESIPFGPATDFRWSSKQNQNVSDPERLASLVVGALLFGYGIYKRSVSNVALGGYLTYRGQTGRCRLYDALGVGSREGDGHSATFTRSVVVNRPRNELYRILRSSPPAGRELNLAAEMEDELLCWSTANDKLSAQYAIELEDVPRIGGTIVRARVASAPGRRGATSALNALARAFTAKRVERDLRELKQLLETGEIATTKGQPSGPSLRRRLTNPIWGTT